MTKPDETKVAAKQVLACIRTVSAALGATGIGKESENKDQHYKFRGIDQILQALNPLLEKAGLIIVPRVVSRVASERVTKSGTKMLNVALEVDFDFFSTYDGSQVTARFAGEGQDSSDKATNKAMSAAYKYMAIQTFCIPVDAASVEDGDRETPTGDRDEDAPPPRSVRTSSSSSGGSGSRGNAQRRRAAPTDESPAGPAAASDAGQSEDGGAPSEAGETEEGQDDRITAAQAEEIKELLEKSRYNAESMLTFYKADSVENLPAASYTEIKRTLARRVATKPKPFKGVRE